jgi:hypothetical protein
MNKLSIILILMLSLVVSVGCAKSDWIQSTLVTVDVTGTWQGSTAGGAGGSFELALEQQGTRVTGSILLRGFTGGNRTGQINGTVAGDVFTFKETNGRVTGETTVSGDEMSGMVRAPASAQITLRRVNSSPRPSTQ